MPIVCNWIMIGILDAVFPLINRYAIDVYFIGGDYSTWPYFIAFNIIVALAFGFSIWGFVYQAGIIEAETSFELRRQAFKNLMIKAQIQGETVIAVEKKKKKY